MSRDHDSFEHLGPHVGTGAPLPPPFTEATVYDTACAIAVALAEVGLTPRAIGQVGLALLRLSRLNGCGTPPTGKEPPPWASS